MADVSFSYRLPLTFVRVTGTRTKTDDHLTARRDVTCQAVVTTETGADPLTEIRVALSQRSLASQKNDWTLTPDGRLTGADVTTTVHANAAWASALRAATTVFAAGSPLLAAGPPGWIALAGAAGVAGVGAGLAVSGAGFAGPLPGADTASEPPADADPAEVDVAEAYVAEHREAARQLANYRATLAEGERQHAAAVHAAVLAEPGDAAQFWQERAQFLQRVLVAAAVGATRAEAAYAQWRRTKVTETTTVVDERIRVDEFPRRVDLEGWASGEGQPLRQAVGDVVDQLRTVVSVDLEDTDEPRGPALEIRPDPAHDTVHHRPPRPAVLRVWKAGARVGGRVALELVETQRLLVAYPGNEAEIGIASSDDTSSAVAVSFDDSGALTRVATTGTGRGYQRADDLTDVLASLGDAADLGTKLRGALSPPSLVERAAEAKAAQQLGLAPAAPVDPETKQLQQELADAQLRAQLKVAQQLADAASPPIVVTVGASLGS